MEDKRTLIAFLIIGLILLLLPYYYEWMGITPDEPVPTQSEMSQHSSAENSDGNTESPSTSPSTSGSVTQADISSSTSKSSAAISQPSENRASSFLPNQSYTPRQIHVETPLQEIVFSTEGGVITSCQLHSFNRIDGTPVELMPNGGRGAILSLQRFDEITDLSSIEFVPDQERIDITGGNQQTLKMSADLDDGRSIQKIFTFYGDRYGFDFELVYRGFDEDTELFITWDKGIEFTEKIPDIDLKEARVFAYFNEELNKITVSDEGDEENWTDKGQLQWAGVRNKYFLSAIAPLSEGRYRVLIQGKGNGAKLMPFYSYEIGFRLSNSGTWEGLFYLGPLNYDNLTHYDEVQLVQAIDFGWPVVRQISRLLLIIFKATYSIIPNYGWIIVLFAVIIKLLVYPLTHKTYESTAKMQEIQPKIAALKEKYKNDNQRLSRETMKLYKEEGVNPLGGCLPMVLQMPIFFSLYNLFGRTIELRQAPFILWINDLSLPDEILIAGFGIHILPLLMAVSMLFQQKMTMKDPKQAFLVYFMPVMMVFIFWKMTSGLVLYWTIFNVLTIVQQVLINRFKKNPVQATA